jgi:hypothetical protein
MQREIRVLARKESRMLGRVLARPFDSSNSIGRHKLKCVFLSGRKILRVDGNCDNTNFLKKFLSIGFYF